jgi:hypothetical protein
MAFKWIIMIVRDLVYYRLHVRGHNMFWGIKGNTPTWVQSLTGDQLKATIQERVRFMTNITMGKWVNVLQIYLDTETYLD